MSNYITLSLQFTSSPNGEFNFSSTVPIGGQMACPTLNLIFQTFSYLPSYESSSLSSPSLTLPFYQNFQDVQGTLTLSASLGSTPSLTATFQLASDYYSSVPPPITIFSLNGPFGVVPVNSIFPTVLSPSVIVGPSPPCSYTYISFLLQSIPNGLQWNLSISNSELTDLSKPDLSPESNFTNLFGSNSTLSSLAEQIGVSIQDLYNAILFSTTNLDNAKSMLQNLSYNNLFSTLFALSNPITSSTPTVNSGFFTVLGVNYALASLITELWTRLNLNNYKETLLQRSTEILGTEKFEYPPYLVMLQVLDGVERGVPLTTVTSAFSQSQTLFEILNTVTPPLSGSCGDGWYPYNGELAQVQDPITLRFLAGDLGLCSILKTGIPSFFIYNQKTRKWFYPLSKVNEVSSFKALCQGSNCSPNYAQEQSLYANSSVKLGIPLPQSYEKSVLILVSSWFNYYYLLITNYNNLSNQRLTENLSNLTTANQIFTLLMDQDSTNSLQIISKNATQNNLPLGQVLLIVFNALNSGQSTVENLINLVTLLNYQQITLLQFLYSLKPLSLSVFSSSLSSQTLAPYLVTALFNKYSTQIKNLLNQYNAVNPNAPISLNLLVDTASSSYSQDLITYQQLEQAFQALPAADQKLSNPNQQMTYFYGDINPVVQCACQDGVVQKSQGYCKVLDGPTIAFFDGVDQYDGFPKAYCPNPPTDPTALQGYNVLKQSFDQKGVLEYPFSQINNVNAFKSSCPGAIGACRFYNGNCTQNTTIISVYGEYNVEYLDNTFHVWAFVEGGKNLTHPGCPENPNGQCGQWRYKVPSNFGTTNYSYEDSTISFQIEPQPGATGKWQIVLTLKNVNGLFNFSGTFPIYSSQTSQGVDVAPLKGFQFCGPIYALCGNYYYEEEGKPVLFQSLQTGDGDNIPYKSCQAAGIGISSNTLQYIQNITALEPFQ